MNRAFSISLAALLMVAPSWSNHANAGPPPNKSSKATTEVKAQGKVILVASINKVKDLKKQIDLVRESRPVDEELVFYYSQRILIFTSQVEAVHRNVADAIKKHPSWALPYLVEADIAELEFREEDQAKYLQKALAVQPLCMNAVFKLAEMKRHTGHPTEAEAILQKALEALPRTPQNILSRREVLKELANLQKDLRDLSGAIATLEEAYALNTKDALTSSKLAEVYLLAEKYQQAKAVCDQTIKDKYEDTSIYYWRAQAYFKLKKLKEAEQDLDRYLGPAFKKPNASLMHTISVESKIRKALDLRAKIYEQTGRKELARAERAHLDALQKETYENTLFRSGK